MIAMSGIFIAIEGPDASGKGTQQRMLVEHMQKFGLPVEPVDFPQYETSIFGNLVGRMLTGEFGDMRKIDPHLASVVFAADRWSASAVIRRHLDNGVNVVANRYTLANMAHQSARLPSDKRSEFIRLMARLEYSEEGFSIPKPDLYLHLDVPIEITQELLLARAQREYIHDGNTDQLESDRIHQLEAAKMYRYLSQTQEGIISIECCDSEGCLQSPEVIHEQVWHHTEALLSGREVERIVKGGPERRG